MGDFSSLSYLTYPTGLGQSFDLLVYIIGLTNRTKTLWTLGIDNGRNVKYQSKSASGGKVVLMGDVFQFRSCASLEQLTGRKANTLDGLLDLLGTCSDSSIFYHTFSAFLKMRQIRRPYNSDFAAWVSDGLNEKALAEKMAAIELLEFNTIDHLRKRLIGVIEVYRKERPTAFSKESEEPFFLFDIERFVYLTDKFAYDLASFLELLPTVSMHSLYYHYIESRLERGMGVDDFSVWIEYGLNLPDLAQKIRAIDIYSYDLEGLRQRIIQLIDGYIKTRGNH